MPATAHKRLPLHYINLKLPDDTGWQARHLTAIRAPRGEEVGIVRLIGAWLAFADEHERNHESRIGDDGYSGPYWASMGRDLIYLLSGPMGNRLDGGTLDTIIRDTLAAEGFDADNL